MALPGFSVSELIQAVGHVKTGYDAFFSKYASSSALLLNLKDEIMTFQKNLEKYSSLIGEDNWTLEESDFKAIQRTLDECEDFLDKYKSILDDGTVSLEKAWRTVRFPYARDDVRRLRDQISRHYENLYFDMHTRVLGMNVKIMESTSRRHTLSVPAQPLVNPVDPAGPTSSPSHRYSLSERPLVPHDSLPDTPAPRPSSWNSSALQQYTSRSDYDISPRSGPIKTEPSDEPDSEQYPEINRVLPQPALSYTVAHVFVGSKKPIDLKRKPGGKYVGKYRALIILDEKGKERFIHKIKLAEGQVCYPYTWHSKWEKHERLEVTFKGMSPDWHTVKFKDQTLGPGTPVYIFETKEDYDDFQGEVRGMELVDYFEFREIKPASSSSIGEATNQYLKIWREPASQECSVSYYANAADKPRDLEFPFAMLNLETSANEDLVVELCFTVSGVLKRKASKSLGRSSTANSSIASSPPGIFSRTPTSFSAAKSLTTTISTSRSRASMSSADSQIDTGKRRGSLSTSDIESQARKMKNLAISFSTQKEAKRFRDVYDRVQREQNESVTWWLDANRGQRHVSTSSVPGSPGPFAMSPILQPLSSPSLRSEQW